MALEDREDPQKKQDEEDVREILRLLKLDFHRLTNAIDFNENARKLAILVNARQRIAMSIFTGTSLIRDPKLKLTTDTGKRRDLALMFQRVLLKNNPATKKMVSEADMNDGSEDIERTESQPK